MHKGRLLRCDTPDSIKAERGVKTLEEAFVQIIKECESGKCEAK